MASDAQQLHPRPLRFPYLSDNITRTRYMTCTNQNAPQSRRAPARADKDGRPGFALLRRSRLGTLKVVQRYPLTGAAPGQPAAGPP
jgi:hypothetical protein